MNTINSNTSKGQAFSATRMFRSKKDLILTRRSSSNYLAKTYRLALRDAHRISWFIYLLNGEVNTAFVDMMEHWVREAFLLTGSLDSVLDAISVLSVTRIDFNDVESCASVRREVIGYVQSSYPMMPRTLSRPLAA